MTCQCILRRYTPMVRQARKPDSSAVPAAFARHTGKVSQP
jgi:hypothetical protein